MWRYTIGRGLVVRWSAQTQLTRQKGGEIEMKVKIAKSVYWEATCPLIYLWG